MKKQVLSSEQMQELVALGIDTSKASMCWIGCSDGNDVYPYNSTFKDIFENHKDTIPQVLTPTFTLQDILEMLPSYKITYDKYTNNSDKYEIRVDIPEGQHYITHIAHSSVSLLEAAFKMLKWCKQLKI